MYMSRANTTELSSYTALGAPLTQSHEVVLRLLGACGTTILFGIRLVIAEFLFGIMAPRLKRYVDQPCLKQGWSVDVS